MCQTGTLEAPFAVYHPVLHAQKARNPLLSPCGVGCISVDGLGTGEELDYRGAFWLATMGGAQALGLEVHSTGRLNLARKTCPSEYCSV